MTKIVKEIPFGEHTLVLETGEIARQADGAVFVSMNGTQVLVTVVGQLTAPPRGDFFPLTVNYQEKTYAAGKIPGGFNKREGRPSEHETLICRLIDRPIRPLFPEGFKKEIQVVATVMSLNPEVPADILSLIGASAALMLSGVPFQGPIGGARVGYTDGVYSLNPGKTVLETSKLDLVVSGTKDAVLMVESEASELSEDVMLGAVMFGHEAMQPVIAAIQELADEGGKAAWDWAAPAKDEALQARVEAMAAKEIGVAYLSQDKTERYTKLAEIRTRVIETFEAEEDEAITAKAVSECLASFEKNLVRSRVLDGEPRIDGRDRNTVRPINIRTSFLERTHGSALFTRGETQAIVAATLGNDRDAQILDKLDGEVRDRFMLHYNFPPYCVGETGMMGSPKRREIGHGRLARRGIAAVLPEMTDFPYVIRVVSDVTESNGSSSMATLCGTSLALMDAGVPLKAPVAGVAMGLIKEGERFAILTDILGDEDHLGDMDFKVAGTESGITALQMDIKITGITQDIMAEALEQALAGRKHILGEMKNALAEHRTELSVHAPRIVSMNVPEDKIRTIIGKGGATIKALTESTGVSIDIDDSGVVKLFSPDGEALANAEAQIKELIAEVEVGKSYTGEVIKIVDFGAFIKLLPNKDGLLHISQICENRNQKVEEVIKEGQSITVFVSGVDKQGRVKLEWKEKPAAKAAEPEVASAESAPSEASDDAS